MHRSDLARLGVLAIAMMLAACNAPSDEDYADPLDNATPANAPSAADGATATGATPGESNPGVPPHVDARSGATLGVSTEGASEAYLIDSADSALYTIEGNDEGTACTDACVRAWPPLLVTDEQPSGGARLQADMIGTLERPDGSVQVTYNGHPLYRYSADTGSGRTAGHDVEDQWGEWYLVSPQGDLLPGDAVQSSGQQPDDQQTRGQSDEPTPQPVDAPGT